MCLFYFSCENTITDSPDISDCNNVPNGSASVDDCGDCVAPEDFNGAKDCTGVCDGSSSFDNCGVCYPGGQDASFEAGKCVQDCFGAWGGTAMIDDCWVCDGDDSCKDCNGNINGTAFTDGCGDCVGGNTEETACATDCNGDWGGSAVVDVCGVCGGGVTSTDDCLACEAGLTIGCDNICSTAPTVYDVCDICGGDGSTCKDCNGVPNGDAVEDNCGTCDNDSSNDCVLDCAGIWGGSSIDDDCGICGGDNSTCIVINEINYNSSDAFNPEDWVELYNSSESPINIGTWKLKDEANDHVFIIPENTILSPSNFIVLCKDTTAFTDLFPEVANFIGNLKFGLGGGGDMIRLFDSYEQLIDVVEYDDEGEWPVEADGTGATLELIHPSLDNTSATNWGYSIDNGTAGENGTPGEINSVYDDE